MKKIISILSLSLMFSFTSLYAEVDGYKDLKFGMNYNKSKKIMERKCQSVDYSGGRITGFMCYKNYGKTNKFSLIF